MRTADVIGWSSYLGKLHMNRKTVSFFKYHIVIMVVKEVNCWVWKKQNLAKTTIYFINNF